MKNRNFGKYVSVAVLGTASLCLQGCGNKLDCNEGKTKDQVLEIIQSHLSNAVWYKESLPILSKNPKLENIKTVSRDDGVNQVQCSGDYSFSLKEKPKKINVNYYLGYLQDKGEIEVKVDVDSVKGDFIGIIVAEKMGR